MCFVTHIPYDDFISADAMSKLRQVSAFISACYVLLFCAAETFSVKSQIVFELREFCTACKRLKSFFFILLQHFIENFQFETKLVNVCHYLKIAGYLRVIQKSYF